MVKTGILTATGMDGGYSVCIANNTARKTAGEKARGLSLRDKAIKRKVLCARALPASVSTHEAGEKRDHKQSCLKYL